MHAFIISEYENVSYGNLTLRKSSVNEGENTTVRPPLSAIQVAVRQGSFTVLYTEAGTPMNAPMTMILSDEWDTYVKPGWKVCLRLDVERFQSWKAKSTSPPLSTMRMAQEAAIRARRSLQDKEALPPSRPDGSETTWELTSSRSSSPPEVLEKSYKSSFSKLVNKDRT